MSITENIGYDRKQQHCYYTESFKLSLNSVRLDLYKLNLYKLYFISHIFYYNLFTKYSF